MECICAIMSGALSPILECYIDEAVKSQTFQPQIMCLSAGSPTVVFDGSVEGCLGCS